MPLQRLPSESAESFENAKAIAQRMIDAAKVDEEPTADVIFAIAFLAAGFLRAKAKTQEQAVGSLHTLTKIAESQMERMWTGAGRA